MLATLLRHGEKGQDEFGEMLSQNGIDGSRRIGVSFRGSKFTHLACTRYTRTMMSLMGVVEGAGDVTAKTVGIIDLLPTDPKDLDHVRLVRGLGRSVQEWLDNRDDCLWFSQWAQSLLHKIVVHLGEAAYLDQNTHMLQVAHTPTIEALVYTTTGIKISPLPTLGWVTLGHSTRTGMWSIVNRS